MAYDNTDDAQAYQQSPEPVPSDYNENPDRMRLARSVLRRHALAGDVHELVARRFIAECFARVNKPIPGRTTTG